MKDTIYVLVSFFLKIALLFFFIMLVTVLAAATGWGQAMPSVEKILDCISSWGQEAFFAAVFLTFVSIHFRIVRRPGKKPLTFLLVFVAAFCILYGGLWELNELFPREREKFSQGADIDRDMVLRGDEIFLWAGGSEDEHSPAGPVVVMQRKDGAGNFRIYAQGRAGTQPGTIVVLGTHVQAAHEEEVLVFRSRVGELPFLLRFFIDDFAFITELLRPQRFVDILVLCRVFIFVFFGFSLWTLAKISRWPLFNLWFTLTIMWLVFSGARFLSLFVVPELMHFETIAGLAFFLPEAFCGFCGFVLFLAGVLGRPLEEWKREMRYD